MLRALDGIDGCNNGLNWGAADDAFSRAIGGLIRHKLHLTRSADAEVATRHHHVGGLSVIADCAVVELGEEFRSNRFLCRHLLLEQRFLVCELLLEHSRSASLHSDRCSARDLNLRR